MKKNNKGFSLVELIVVILIMAIIAVALAPQVMKWVDKSKVNTDINNRTNLKAAMDAAVADYFAQGGSFVDGKTVSFTVNGKEPSGWDGTNYFGDAITADADETVFRNAVEDVLNESWPEFKSTDNGYFSVSISSKGVVDVYVYNGVSGEDYGDGQKQPATPTT